MEAQMLEAKVDYTMKLKPTGTRMAITGVAIHFGLFPVWTIRSFRTMMICITALQSSN
jgi:hypothetical protein